MTGESSPYPNGRRDHVEQKQGCGFCARYCVAGGSFSDTILSSCEILDYTPQAHWREV